MKTLVETESYNFSFIQTAGTSDLQFIWICALVHED